MKIFLISFVAVIIIAHIWVILKQSYDVVKEGKPKLKPQDTDDEEPFTLPEFRHYSTYRSSSHEKKIRRMERNRQKNKRSRQKEMQSLAIKRYYG